VLVPYKDFEAILRHADNSTIREHVKHADESLAAAKNGELLERISHNRQQ
jgi:thimet oligopeptidase